MKTFQPDPALLSNDVLIFRGFIGSGHEEYRDHLMSLAADKGMPVRYEDTLSGSWLATEAPDPKRLLVLHAGNSTDTVAILTERLTAAGWGDKRVGVVSFARKPGTPYPNMFVNSGVVRSVTRAF